MEKLVVYPERKLSEPRQPRRLVFSQRGALALTQAGMSREDAYAVVQRNAGMKVWAEARIFSPCCRPIRRSRPFWTGALAALFDLGYHTKRGHDLRQVFGRR